MYVKLDVYRKSSEWLAIFSLIFALDKDAYDYFEGYLVKMFLISPLYVRMDPSSRIKI